jgi:hypothetical protein
MNQESTNMMHAPQEMILVIVIIGQHIQLLLFHYNALEFLNLQLMFCYLSRTQKSYNQNLLYQEMSTRSGSNLV